MQFGLVTNPVQIIEFLKTGQVDSLIEGQFADLMLVREENEKMRLGEIPPVLRTDMHPYHIEEHRKLLSDPDMRMNPELVNAVLSHMQEHEMFIQPPAPVDPATGQPIEQMPPDAGPPAENPNLPTTPPGTPPETEQAYQEGVVDQQQF
jgi:hypothetical protein